MCECEHAALDAGRLVARERAAIAPRGVVEVDVIVTARARVSDAVTRRRARGTRASERGDG